MATDAALAKSRVVSPAARRAQLSRSGKVCTHTNMCKHTPVCKNFRISAYDDRHLESSHHVGVNDFSGEAMWERIEDLARAEGHTHDSGEINWSEVAKHVGLFRNTVAAARKRGGLNAETLYKIAQGYDVNCHWILTGRGPRSRFDGESPPDPKQVVLTWSSELYPPAVIRAIRSEEMPGQTIFFWTRRFEAVADQMIAEGKISAEDVPRPRPPTKPRSKPSRHRQT